MSKVVVTVAVLVALLSTVLGSPLLDLITKWVKKSGKTKLGKGIMKNFELGGKGQDDQDNGDDPLEFEKQSWLIDTGQVKLPKFSMNRREQRSFVRKFQSYYRCLAKRNHDRSGIREKAVALKPGMAARLKCNMCQYPGRSHSAIWQRQLSFSTAIQAVPIDMSHFALTPSMTLVLNAALRRDSGVYICQSATTTHAIYSVDVTSIGNTITVHSEKAPKGPYSLGVQRLSDYNLEVFVSWGAWTSCSRCDQVGRRYRWGMCHVKLIDQNHAVKLLNRDATIITSNLFDEYPEGIPCRSTLLPQQLRDIKQIIDYRDEREVRYCKVPCPRTGVWRVMDGYGHSHVVWLKNSIEAAARRTSHAASGTAQVQTAVSRGRTHTTAQTGENIRIVCAGADRSVILQWQKGAVLLDPVKYRRQTAGRVLIDINHVLHIRRVRQEDADTYSCWQNEQMVAVTELEVEHNFIIKHKEYIVVVGVSTVLTLLAIYILYAFYKSCCVKRLRPKPKMKMITSIV